MHTITSPLFETATTLARSGSTLVAVNAQFVQPPPIDPEPEVVVLDPPRSSRDPRSRSPVGAIRPRSPYSDARAGVPWWKRTTQRSSWRTHSELRWTAPVARRVVHVTSTAPAATCRATTS